MEKIGVSCELVVLLETVMTVEFKLLPKSAIKVLTKALLMIGLLIAEDKESVVEVDV